MAIAVQLISQSLVFRLPVSKFVLKGNRHGNEPQIIVYVVNQQGWLHVGADGVM
jgi:hypothetical protein